VGVLLCAPERRAAIETENAIPAIYERRARMAIQSSGRVLTGLANLHLVGIERAVQ